MESQYLADVSIRQNHGVNIHSEQMIWIGKDETDEDFLRRIVFHVTEAVRRDTSHSWVEIRAYILGRVNELEGTDLKSATHNADRRIVWGERESGAKLVRVLITGHSEWTSHGEIRLGFYEP